ncbi:TPA: H-NS histone family protein [Stenotrophomonas maltophilia]|nr:H-NS histone family protein [Stenotrophomonas maltophilia]
MSIDLSGLSAKELGALIKNAKKQQTIVAKRPAITKVRAQLTKLAKANGYTLEEVAGVAAPARGRAGKAATAAPAKAVRKLGKVAPKYRNPANPKETWTGRGKQPRWLAAHTTKGKKLEDFLIKK